MSKTVVLYTAELDDSQPATRHCGLTVEPGPTVIAWVGRRADGVQLHLPPELACQTAIQLIGAALDAGLTPDMFRRVLATLDDLAAVAGIAESKTSDRPDHPPRGVHAH